MYYIIDDENDKKVQDILDNNEIGYKEFNTSTELFLQDKADYYVKQKLIEGIKFEDDKQQTQLTDDIYNAFDNAGECIINTEEMSNIVEEVIQDSELNNK